MNGNSIVLDTNIVLYLLNGDEKLSAILDGMQLFLTVITEIELLGYYGLSSNDKSKIKLFLSECSVVSLNNEIKDLSITLKQKSKVKTPDAIVASTALFLQLPLITADKGFSKIENLDLILYQF
ncbi:MAG: type II toxin-antitoxin system VapC family toxin [Flavobacterium sp.]|uniref:type II toxin-antitoxin system VapC family toxin n=1 Tax=Flavobacterium sp. TaxID=239 RepID=UPI00262AE5F9|nr:type II toxin-antitoxin system VapC family toxin [Flavobacterium sp.]MDD5150806.1 type II toxin-antitoxin system VapC family toxin [Flavobacterium sp.]